MPDPTQSAAPRSVIGRTIASRAKRWFKRSVVDVRTPAEFAHWAVGTAALVVIAVFALLGMIQATELAFGKVSAGGNKTDAKVRPAVKRGSFRFALILLWFCMLLVIINNIVRGFGGCSGFDSFKTVLVWLRGDYY